MASCPGLDPQDLEPIPPDHRKPPPMRCDQFLAELNQEIDKHPATVNQKGGVSNRTPLQVLADAKASTCHYSTSVVYFSSQHLLGVKLLLQRGATVGKLKDANAALPDACCIPCAASERHVEAALQIIEALIDAGAKVDDWKDEFPYPGEPRSTALARACDTKSEEHALKVVSLLLRRGASVHGKFAFEPMTNALRNGNLDVARLLIANGASVNAVSKGSATTCLHFLCSSVGSSDDKFSLKDPKVIGLKFLLDQGANHDAQDKNRNRPSELMITNHKAREWVQQYTSSLGPVSSGGASSGEAASSSVNGGNDEEDTTAKADPEAIKLVSKMSRDELAALVLGKLVSHGKITIADLKPDENKPAEASKKRKRKA